MLINGINQNAEQLSNINFAPKPDQAVKNTSTFEDFYNAALALIDETSQYQKQADQAQLNFAIGKDNMLSVMLAQEKATASLSFTIQVTNKVVEAYREIMRIQI